MNKLIILTLLFMGLCNPKQAPLETVASVDLEKYTGIWYEIALFPNSFEKGCHCTTAEYQLTDKNYVRVINSCNENAVDGKRKVASGKAFVVKGSNNAKLKVQFFWPFRGDYWIIGLADDYSWALVGDPGRKYLWVLARSRTLDESTYNSILEIAKSKGFDVNKLVKTEQACK